MAEADLLLDGWPLCAAPNSPAALQLLSLLHSQPTGITLHLALPAETPAWLEPVHFQPVSRPARLGGGSRLVWVQNTLPGLARKLRVKRLVLCGEAAPLASPVPQMVFPAGYNLVRPPGTAGAYQGLADRLGASLGWGGLSRAEQVLWPSDLPAPDNLPGQEKIAPFVHPDFHPQASGFAEVLAAYPDLPESFVLYHGPAYPWPLDLLLNAWGWVSQALGDAHPLLLAGLSPQETGSLQARLVKHKLTDSVRSLPALPPRQLSGLYQQCTVFFHPAPCSPWGDPLRHALACGRPIVAANVPFSDRLLGPAAYTASYLDARALGAALISVLVEQSLAERLAQASLERATAWSKNSAKLVLETI